MAKLKKEIIIATLKKDGVKVGFNIKKTELFAVAISSVLAGFITYSKHIGAKDTEIAKLLQEVNKEAIKSAGGLTNVVDEIILEMNENEEQ